MWPWWGVGSECQGPGSGVSLPVWPPTWSGSSTSPGGPALMQGPGAWLRHLLYTHRALVTAGHIPEPLLPLLVSSFLSGYPLFSACLILDGGWRGRHLESWLGSPALLPTATRPGRKEVHSLDCGASPSGLQALVCSSLPGPIVACLEGSWEVAGCSLWGICILVGAWSLCLPPKQCLFQKSTWNCPFKIKGRFPPRNLRINHVSQSNILIPYLQ